jgi:FKBP-type peptidyl-prolyl cis-trans isomerase SlyD
MKVEPRNYVSIHYALTINGDKVDSTDPGEPLGFIQGTGQVIEGLDKAILGKAAGEKFSVTVPPELAYGERDERMYREIPLENFPADMKLEVGMGFTATGPHGPVAFRVVRVEGDSVTADFNHPLAGETLTFDVEVAEVREPRAEELAALDAGGDEGCSDEDCSSCGGGCGCN